MEYLPPEFKPQYLGAGDRELTFKRPMLYQTGGEMEQAQLYLARADDLPAMPPIDGVAVVVIGRNLSDAWKSARASIVTVSSERTLSELMNAVQQIFDFFDEWDRNLLEQLSADTEFHIQDFLAEGLRVLGNPLTVTSASLKRILTTEYDENHMPRTTEGEEGFPISWAEQIKNNCLLERFLEIPFLSSFQFSDLPISQVYCMNLYHLGTFFGCIVLSDEYKTFRKSDLALAAHYFKRFQGAFQRYLHQRPSVQRPWETALQALLQRKPLNTAEYEALTLAPGEQWVCVFVNQRPDTTSYHKEYLCTALCMSMPDEIHPILYADQVFGLMRISADAEEQHQRMTRFADILARLGYRGGISSPFTSLSQFHSYLSQAKFALEFAQAQGESGELFDFQERILDYVLQNCAKNLAVQTLCSNGIRALTEYDRQKGTEYLKTAEVYLEHEMNLTKAAAALFIHRTSLVKRLERIQQLTDGELDRADLRLFYRIWFRLQKDPEI